MSSAPNAQYAPQPNQYKGVNGWLVLFCIELILLNPAATLTESLYWLSVTTIYARMVFGFAVTLYISIVIHALVSLLGVIAGLFLLAVKPYAIKLAKAYFIALVIYYILSAGLLSLSSGIAAGRVAVILWRWQIWSFVFVVVWYSYLKKSKRVKATYFDADEEEHIKLNLK